MRVAFFGGTFDPPHRGHIAIAHAAIARLALDRVLVAPVAAQPLKNGVQSSSFADRLAMVRLAVQGDPRLTPSDVDGPRPDRKPNYTLDTLAEVQRNLASGDKLFCLLGADAFLSLNEWHRATELLLFCDFIVAGRPGFPLEQISPALPHGIAAVGWRHEPGCIHVELEGPAGERSILYFLTGMEEDVSATEIRAAIAEGSPEQTVLAPQVAAYIRKHALYGFPRTAPALRQHDKTENA